MISHFSNLSLPLCHKFPCPWCRLNQTIRLAVTCFLVKQPLCDFLLVFLNLVTSSVWFWWAKLLLCVLLCVCMLAVHSKRTPCSSGHVTCQSRANGLPATSQPANHIPVLFKHAWSDIQRQFNALIPTSDWRRMLTCCCRDFDQTSMSA